MIIGIRWYDFVRNTEVIATTNLPSVQDIITKRWNSLFGHLVRLDDHTPAHRALSQVAAVITDSCLDSGWRRRLGRRTTHGYSRSAAIPLLASALNAPRPPVVSITGWRNGPPLSTRCDDDDDDDRFHARYVNGEWMAPEQKITPIYLTLSQYLIAIGTQESSTTQYSTLSDISDI